MNMNHTPDWGKGQLCLEIQNLAIFGDFAETTVRPRSRNRLRSMLQKPAVFNESNLFLDFFDTATEAKTRKKRTPPPFVDPGNVPALVVAFARDEFLTKVLVEDLFHVVACVAVSTRWASEWPTLERWIGSASLDQGGAGFWCEAAGLCAEEFLPTFWMGIKEQRAELDQDERAVRAYGENLGEIWPIYKKMTLGLNHFMWRPSECQEFPV